MESSGCSLIRPRGEKVENVNGIHNEVENYFLHRSGCVCFY